MSFGNYFIARELNEDVFGVISESVTKDLYHKGVLKGGKKAQNSLLSHLKDKYTDHFCEKFPKVQYEDIEEAIYDSFKKMADKKHDSSNSAERLFKQSVYESLSGLHIKKRDAKRNLSCIRRLKSAGEMNSIMKRAEKMLTSQERKIIDMCSQGKSVRAIGSELGLSSATAWRSLNDGLDKIRLSHGMKSRKLG